MLARDHSPHPPPPPPSIPQDGQTPPYTPYYTPNHRVQRSRYITSNDPRGYIPVYEYPLNSQWIMMDIDDGYVLWTGIWKALGNSKADIVKMIESQPDLAPQLRRVRGGYLKIQGTWMPYEIALRLARRVAWPIRDDLVPLFGPTFPATCLAPDQPGYGQVVPSAHGRRRARRPPLALPHPDSQPVPPHQLRGGAQATAAAAAQAQSGLGLLSSAASAQYLHYTPSPQPTLSHPRHSPREDHRYAPYPSSNRLRLPPPPSPHHGQRSPPSHLSLAPISTSYPSPTSYPSYPPQSYSPPPLPTPSAYPTSSIPPPPPRGTGSADSFALPGIRALLDTENDRRSSPAAVLARLRAEDAAAGLGVATSLSSPVSLHSHSSRSISPLVPPPSDAKRVDFSNASPPRIFNVEDSSDRDHDSASTSPTSTTPWTPPTLPLPTTTSSSKQPQEAAPGIGSANTSPGPIRVGW